jgi:excisionase family DNA binding protein
MSRGSNTAHGGIAPFGYKWVGGTLVLDASEAAIRKLIFELFLKHRRKKVVARIVNELGHRTRNGSLFSDTTIGRLLADPIVTGVRYRDVDGGELERLISDDIWNETQALLGSRPIKQTLRLFTGIVYCDCGRKMLISSGSSKYACATCRKKISEVDLAEIFHAKLNDRSIFETSELSDRWYELPARDRRMLIEHICDRIIAGKDSLTFEIGYAPGTPDAPNALSSRDEEIADEVLSSDESLLSEAEAARFLGVSKMTLLRKRHSTEISFFRVGSRVLYSRQKHLLPYLAKNENKLH